MRATRRAIGPSIVVTLVLGATFALFAPPTRAITLLSEDFESGVLGPAWTAADNNAASGLDYWGVTNFRAGAGTYSAWAAFVGTQAATGQPNTAVNQYDNNMEADLSYAIPPGYFSLTLSVYYWAKGEGGGGDVFQIWYDDGGVLTMLFDNRGTANWDFASVVVPDTADRIILRWKADAANNNFEGAYVDDVVLTGNFGSPDTTPPWSNLLALPPLTNLAAYPIDFTAQDGVNETGVAYVELWYRQGVAGPFTLFTTAGNPLGRWTTTPVPFDSTAALGDGYYEFYSIAVDNATNAEAAPALADANMTIDSTPPSLALLVPAPGWWSSLADVNASWSGSDATSGLDHFETSLDGAPLASVGNATNQSLPGLPEGLHSFLVLALDVAGNQVTVNSTFGVDLTDPAVAVTAPAPGSWSNSTTVTVNWTGSDLPSGLDRYETSLDSGPFAPVGLATSQPFAGLADGGHTVDVRAFDLSGRTAADSVSFFVDATAPVVAVTAPVPGAWFGTSLVTVSWNGSDALAGLDRYEIRLDAGGFVSAGLNTTANFTGLAEGGHTVDVRAFDALGNAATASVTFSVDLSAPAVAVTSPPGGAWLGTSAVTVAWTGSDLLSGLDRYETRIDGGPYASNGLITSQLFPGLTEGPHTVDVAAFDVVGNTVGDSVTFNVDLAAPLVAVTSPAPGAWFATNSVTVTWTGSDSPSGLDRYETRLDAGAFFSNGLFPSAVFSGVAEGPHMVEVLAVDLAGNTALASVTFSVDLSAPSVAVTSPASGSWSSVDSVTVTWSGSDPLSGLDRYETSLDAAPFSSSGLGTSRGFTGLSQGGHTLDVRAYDAVGNFATATVTFSVDLTAPTVGVSAPTANAWLGVNSVAVTWTGADTLSGLDRYETRVDGGAFSSSGLTATRTFSGLAEGVHTVEVRAYDLVGHFASSSVTFSVDLSAPAVSVTSPAATTWLATSSLDLAWTGSDSRSGLDRFETRVDGGAFASRGLATNLSLASLAEGPHTADVRAYDRVGNFATATVTFSIDLTPPAVAVSSPANGAWFAITDVTVGWTGSDALSGLDRYETRLDTGNFASEGLAVSRGLSTLAEGPHAFEIRAFDLAGNLATTTVTFGVDTAAPTLTIGSPLSGTVITAPKVTVSWTGADANSGIDRYEVRIDGGAVIVTDDQTRTLQNLGDGAHTVQIRAYDASGNYQDVTLTFRVNTNVLSGDGPFGPWVLLFLLLFPILLLLLLLLAWRRRKEDEEKKPDEMAAPAGAAPSPQPTEDFTFPPPPPPDFVVEEASPGGHEALTDTAAPDAAPVESTISETPGGSLVEGAPDGGGDALAAMPAAAVPAPTEDAPPAPLVPGTSSGSPRCAACHGRIREGFPLLRCPACPAVYHGSCSSRASACTTCGLVTAPPAMA